MKNAALVLVGLLSLQGCTEDPIDEPMADCVPSEAEWNEGVRQVVMDNCGACHGTRPDFGAPFTLLDYAAITAGVEGERIVDEMHMQLSAGSMPPPGVARPTVDNANRIAQWASCGAVTIEDTENSSRPPFMSPEDPPEGLETIDLLASELSIAPDVLDDYEDIDFTNLTDEDVFIRRFDVVLDETEVVHHLTLRRGDPADGDFNMKYLYAWAPGTGAIEFPDGGVRLRPGDNLRLQIHYNNGAGLEGVMDSSGVRLFVGPVAGREYEMADPGPGATGFRIPARSTETVESTCEISESVRAIASMPHMHENGTAFNLLLERADEEQMSILELYSWAFETQLFYSMPLDLARGDKLTVRCEFENNTDSVVSAGPRTADEMCFAFTYVTPPPSAVLCVPEGSGEATVLEYEPGTCIDEPIEDLEGIRASVVDSAEAPVFDEGGTLPEGRLVLERYLIATPSPGLVGLATVNGAAQMERTMDTVAIDGAFHIVAATDGLRNGVQNDIQVAGDLLATDGPSAIGVTCPAAADFPEMVFGTVDGQAAVRLDAGSNPVETIMWFFFTPAE